MSHDRLTPEPATLEARLLSDHPACSVYIRTGSHRAGSLARFGICRGDVLAVDLTLPPVPGVPTLFVGERTFYVDIWIPGQPGRREKPCGFVTGLYRKLNNGGRGDA